MTILDQVKKVMSAFHSGLLGDTSIPEDSYPEFQSLEQKRIYYTLPMALNYQRNSFVLWAAAKNTFEDSETRDVFDINYSSNAEASALRSKLQKYKLALQPNKHIDTWQRISKSLANNFGTISKLFEDNDSDYTKIKELIQVKSKKDFPYLSGPKIFNYWIYIMSKYGEVPLKNRSLIEIAPDTHVIQSSIKLGIISKEESLKLKREDISKIWRELLDGTNIDPIDVHPPLWLWSRGGFKEFQ